jgi:hypothetical protein
MLKISAAFITPMTRASTRTLDTGLIYYYYRKK